MRPTPPLAVIAERACIYAASARKSRKASRAKTRHAILLTASALLLENRRTLGKSYSRSTERALRGEA